MSEIKDIPDKFKIALENLNSMISSDKPQMDIDNEVSKMKERYGMDTKLNNRGYKNLKKILDKYWSGKRLDDQELTLAYVLCPKIILYEDVQFRVLDMVNEIENELMERWGSKSSPINPAKVVKNMIEPNPEYVELGLPIIDCVWRRITLKQSLEEYGITKYIISQEQRWKP